MITKGDGDATEFLAWALQMTPKQVGRLKISTIKAKWLEAGLPPATIAFKNVATGATTPLYELGQAKRKSPKRVKQSKPSDRPKTR